MEIDCSINQIDKADTILTNGDTPDLTLISDLHLKYLVKKDKSQTASLYSKVAIF